MTPRNRRDFIKRGLIQSVVLFVLFIFLLSACGLKNNDPPVELPKTYFVAPPALGGSDQQAGTEVAPFSTMTHALSVAKAGDTIQIAAGTYQSGETFPLRIKPGIILMGVPHSATPVTILQGNGPYVSPNPTVGSIQAAIIIEEGASISNLAVRSGGEVGLLAEGVRAEVKSSEFSNNRIGLLVIGSGMNISANAVNANKIGIQVLAGDASRFERNNITNNNASPGVGVEITDAGPIFRQNRVISNQGGGIVVHGTATPDLGEQGINGGFNTLICNDAGDLIHYGSELVKARNNLWDHVFPDLYNIDALKKGTGEIDAEGADFAISRCTQ
ncbi:MAG: DUF1565 domain-containing protein [Candidatus Manganitrophaceae bacterium]